MGTGYTRQSAGSIIAGNVITAAPLNAEFNQLQAAFDGSSGHSHDGTSGEGPQINLTNSVTGTLPVGSGGTGATTLTDGGLLIGKGTSAVTATAVLGDGEIVIGDGVTNPQLLAAFTSSTGTLKHEYGGLEADVSAYDGLIKISGGATSAVSAPSGDVVGTSDAQTLTNKTIVAANNTITMASTDLSDTNALTYNADTDASALGFVIDEDNMVSDSATKVPTQQSVKAYADTKLSLTGGTLTGNLTMSSSAPVLTLSDTDDASNFSFYTDAGTLLARQSGPAGAATGGQIIFCGTNSTSDLAYFRVRIGGALQEIIHTGNIGSYALKDLVDDTSPQLGGNLDLNGSSIVFPSVTITDVLDEDTMSSDSATAVPTQQSVKAYVDNLPGVSYASAGETSTGTETAKSVSPDGLAGSIFGTQVVQLLVFDDSTDVSIGDGAGDLFFRIPSTLNGMDLVGVAACVQTAGTTGTTDIQIHNVTQAADMLSTKITIDSGETDSSTAATAAVIDTLNDDVATGDQLRIDVDAVSTTGPKGLLVELQFRLP